MSISDFFQDIYSEFDISDYTIGREILSSFFTTADSALYSGRQVLEQFRDIGGHIGTGDFFALKREVLGLDIKPSAIMGVPIDSSPRPETFAPAKTYQESTYKYIYEAELYNYETGELEYINRPFLTNFINTIGQTIDDISDYIKENSPELYDSLQSVRIVRAYRKV